MVQALQPMQCSMSTHSVYCFGPGLAKERSTTSRGSMGLYSVIAVSLEFFHAQRRPVTLGAARHRVDQDAVAQHRVGHVERIDAEARADALVVVLRLAVRRPLLAAGAPAPVGVAHREHAGTDAARHAAPPLVPA